MPIASLDQDAEQIVPPHSSNPMVGRTQGPIPERSKTLRKTSKRRRYGNQNALDINTSNREATVYKLDLTWQRAASCNRAQAIGCRNNRRKSKNVTLTTIPN